MIQNVVFVLSTNIMPNQDEVVTLRKSKTLYRVDVDMCQDIITYSGRLHEVLVLDTRSTIYVSQRPPTI